MNKKTALLAALAFGLFQVPAVSAASDAEELLNQGRSLVIAHRGYSEIAPENTLRAFALGVVSGADLVELDYHVTREGTEIVIHDKTLDRTTDAVARWGEVNAAVGDRSLEALQTLDAGSWFADGALPEMLPTLVEAVESIHSMGGMPLIERKEGPAESMARLLTEHNWTNRVLIQSFNWDYLRSLHREVPEQILGALGPWKTVEGRQLTRKERELSTAWIDTIVETGARFIGWNRYVNPDAIRYAHEKGLRVFVYTINDIELAQSLLSMGVDGIITDNPSIVWKALAVSGS